MPNIGLASGPFITTLNICGENRHIRQARNRCRVI